MWAGLAKGKKKGSWNANSGLLKNLLICVLVFLIKIISKFNTTYFNIDYILELSRFVGGTSILCLYDDQIWESVEEV